MRLHRFYVSPKNTELKRDFWLKDERLRQQWTKVLRLRPGDEVILFDGIKHERLYRIERIAPDAFHLILVTDFERKLPSKHIYLFFSLLKKDKNDWVLQKCTELGVRNFVPIIAERSEKTGFNMERAEKIVIEAAEQCGRGDIPSLRELMSLETALKEYKDKISLMVCDEELSGDVRIDNTQPLGALIGPEGGWSEAEKKLFADNGVGHLSLGDLTLRAETAAVAATTKLIQ